VPWLYAFSMQARSVARPLTIVRRFLSSVRVWRIPGLGTVPPGIRALRPRRGRATGHLEARRIDGACRVPADSGSLDGEMRGNDASARARTAGFGLENYRRPAAETPADFPSLGPVC